MVAGGIALNYKNDFQIRGVGGVGCRLLVQSSGSQGLNNKQIHPGNDCKAIKTKP
jgi:hypothetical protein